MNSYYRTFSELTSWKRTLVEKARKEGHVTTLYGRRRRLPDLRSSDTELRSRAERQAINAIVQGTAADICKQAMVDVYNRMKGTSVKLVVQVHDELVATVHQDEAPTIISPFLKAMGDGMVLDKVPIKVSHQFAKSWAEAKE